ncbi:MAG: UDP-N-acetylmuramate--L-alanine ligase [Anaerolineae bacterium]
MKNGRLMSMPPRVHMIGVGGIGLSAIARVLAARGVRVTGCDLTESALTESLRQAGIPVTIGHSEGHLLGVDLVVVSSAVPETNPEVAAARRKGLPVVHRRELLARMMRGSDGIAVAGTHGKTTTTAMIAYVLSELGHDPTYVVGGLSADLGGNAGAGAGRWFVLEADEYDHAFADLQPWIGVVNNVEMDHPDCFANLEAVRRAFAAFMAHVRSDGWLVAGVDSPQVRALLDAADIQARVVTFGQSETADCRLRDVQAMPGGGVSFVWSSDEQVAIPVTLRVPGRHNALNATAAMAVVTRCGVDLLDAAAVLERFEGVARRFEVKGARNGITIVDDYAHHPTEIRATLAAARARYPGRRLVAVFQPHTYSRTEALLDEFAACFADADLVRLVDIFPARPSECHTITSQELAAVVDHRDVAHTGDIEQTTARLRAELEPGDVLITLGAGPGYLIGESLLAGQEVQP